MSLSHFDAQGQAHMVDVSAKPDTTREAVAEGLVLMSAETLALAGGAAKGDVMGVARLAGIMGAKRTSDLIPLCHPLPIAKVSVDLRPIRPCPASASPPPCAPPARPASRWRP
jgi:cyclic pyranopterin phosphate synthase